MLVVTIIVFLSYLSIFYKLKRKSNTIRSTSELKISVIISAKNEKDNLSNLISSLHNQNYSNENYEVIIVDDNSVDSTYSTAKDLINEYDNFKIIKAGEKKYIGKRGALQVGIDSSKYEYIVITDADCKVNHGFIKSFSEIFNENNDFIFGIAPFNQNNTLSNKIACFDNLWVHILTFSFANIGLPYSAAARSFGFQKKSFERINGYQNTTDTLSGDDDLLLREAVRNKLRIDTITDSDSFVFTDAKESLGEFIKQKSRHTSTSNFYSIKVKLFLGLWHFLNLFMLFSVFLIPLNVNFVWLVLTKFIWDVIIIKYLMKTFSYKFNFIEIIVLQIFYELLLIVNYIRGLFYKDTW